jgi:hypothetical protein
VYRRTSTLNAVQCNKFRKRARATKQRLNEAEGKNDIILSVDQITRPRRPRCRNARVCISRAEADVTAVEGFGLLSVWGSEEFKARVRVSLQLRHRTLTFILLLHAKRRHRGDRRHVSMRTVLALESEHVELTREFVIFDESASFFFHVSEERFCNCLVHSASDENWRFW